MNEKEIIQKAHKGDMAAFEHIVRIYEKQVLALAMQVVQNEQDAQDVTQDVFITLYRKIGMFRFESGFFPWLYRIVMNTSFNYTKSRKHHEFFTNDEDDDNYYAVADEETAGLTESEDF